MFKPLQQIKRKAKTDGKQTFNRANYLIKTHNRLNTHAADQHNLHTPLLDTRQILQQDHHTDIAILINLSIYLHQTKIEATISTAFNKLKQFNK